MKSKSELLAEYITDKRVLDIGGSGYGASNTYEEELCEVLESASDRTVLDQRPNADIQLDLNVYPLPSLPEHIEWDVTLALDVLQFVDRPIDVLRWIPTKQLIVQLPNVVSFVEQMMEREESEAFAFLYSFNADTGARMLRRAGWKIDRMEYTFGKWSLKARILNSVGSLWPSRSSTGLFYCCSRA